MTIKQKEYMSQLSNTIIIIIIVIIIYHYRATIKNEDSIQMILQN